jgi:hypothetical protein
LAPPNLVDFNGTNNGLFAISAASFDVSFGSDPQNPRIQDGMTVANFTDLLQDFPSRGGTALHSAAPADGT